MSAASEIIERAAARPARTLADAWDGARARGNNFDAIRLVAASLVIFSHAFYLTGSWDNDPVFALTGQVHSGKIGVLIFFSVSGFLVAMSWRRSPALAAYAVKRALRILPALFVVVAMLILVVGPLVTDASASAYFSSRETWAYWLNAILIDHFNTLPGVFAENSHTNVVNGPLWTLLHEVACYAFVAALGATRALKPLICALLLVLFLAVSTFPELAASGVVVRKVFQFSLVAPAFFAGVLAAVAADKIPYDARLAAVAALCVIVAGATSGLYPALAVCGAYLIFFVAFAPLGPVRRAARFGDFSYGLYLWGWPIQQIVESMAPGADWRLNLLISFPLTLVAAAASWKIVEQPALRLKARLAPARPARPRLAQEESGAERPCAPVAREVLRAGAAVPGERDPRR